MAIEHATLAGGCFWCLEAAFARLRGVTQVDSGYAGGSKADPSYHEVCSGRTGHAEVVRVAFDPEVVSYEQLLQVFFTIHDPTTPNRQGADIGTQYRSAIFFESPAQERAARAFAGELRRQEIWPDPIVTEIVPLVHFYPAEPYHREYYERNPDQAYCRAVIAPKLAKLRAAARELLREVEA